jgi:cytochrome b561
MVAQATIKLRHWATMPADSRLASARTTQAAAPWRASIRFFHWLIAALIFAQYVLGWLAASWGLSPTKINLFVWHKSLGILVLALVILRLLNRLTKPTPALPAAMPAWERTAARASHALLYLAMIAMPITGWVIHSASGVPFRIFWQVPLPPLVAPDKHTADLAAVAHFSLGVVFVALIVLHVGAALRHHFIKHDDVLTRMMSSRPH